MTPTPRAVSHFGLTALEARTARAARAPTADTAAAPVHEAQPHRRIVVRLWLPLTPLFLLLAPFALLLAPLIYFAPRPYRTRPLATVMGLGRVLLSLGGTVVHVDTPEALVSIRVF